MSRLVRGLFNRESGRPRSIRSWGADRQDLDREVEAELLREAQIARDEARAEREAEAEEVAAAEQAAIRSREYQQYLRWLNNYHRGLLPPTHQYLMKLWLDAADKGTEIAPWTMPVPLIAYFNGPRARRTDPNGDRRRQLYEWLQAFGYPRDQYPRYFQFLFGTILSDDLTPAVMRFSDRPPRRPFRQYEPDAD